MFCFFLQCSVIPLRLLCKVDVHKVVKSIKVV